MNDISYFFIMLFGLTFGYVFPDLLHELGLSKKFSYSWAAVFLLVLLSFVGFVAFPIIIFGHFTFNNFEYFYSVSGGVFIGLAIALLLGGGAHLAYRAYSERK